MVAPILPNAVVVEMAKREHRMQHYLWHAIRNSWIRLTPSQRQEIKNIDPMWEPPRPVLDKRGNIIRDNNSGEDFLYMHREMIAQVNSILARTGDPNYPKIEGWINVPMPGDTDYPVPELEGLEDVKSDSFYNNVLLAWEMMYRSSDYLRSVTLGQLGSDIEFTIHNNMHMRWAGPSPVGYRPSTPIAQPIDKRWDSPAYDFLGDTYSSHVNPIFWKLHGWVDNRIEDWKKSNEITDEIKWKGTWTGPMIQGHHKKVFELPALFTDRKLLSKLERATEIVASAIASNTGVFDGFFKPLGIRNLSFLHTKSGSKK